ncbi:NADH-quinone oxidoreductase subunit C [Streptomyces sp. NPDC003042]
MNLYDSLPDGAPAIFGAEAVGTYAYDVLTVDVPVGSWIPALEIARDKLACTYFDWLSAVDEPGTGFRICAHVVSLENHRVRRLLLRTTVPHASPSLPSAVAVYAGAAWHERETFEMFGVVFTDHPNLVPLLLPENFEGHPLRKDFVLAARVAKAWPGAKEPGEGADPEGPKRRQMLPPGVPDPNDWGPMKGQLPPAPTRPARTPRAAGAAPTRRPRPVPEDSATETAPTPDATPTDAARPPRRTRSVSEGSASQAAPAAEAAPAANTADASSAPTAPTAPAPTDAARPPGRTRSVSEGSASQAPPARPTGPAPEGSASRPAPPEPSGAALPADAPPAADGSASQAAPAPADTPARPPRTRSVADGSASQATPAPAGPGNGTTAPEPEAPPRSADAPWHDPKPAFEEPEPAPEPRPRPKPKPDTDPDPDPNTDPDPDTDTTGGDA